MPRSDSGRVNRTVAAKATKNGGRAPMKVAPPAVESRARREKTENNLEKLLSTAAALMAKRGYDNTSIRDVGRETGFSLAGMYYYVRGKEDLLYKIQQQTFGNLLRDQEALAAKDGTAEEKLRRLVSNHLSYLTTHANELKVCTFEMESLQGDYYRDVENLRKRYFKLIAGLVAEFMRAPAGDAKANANIRQHTLFIFGMLNWVFMWFDARRDSPIDRLGNKMVDFVLRGLPTAEAAVKRSGAALTPAVAGSATRRVGRRPKKAPKEEAKR